MTELDLQQAIYKYRSQIQPFPLMVSNIYFYYWESDVLYISNSNYLTEFEIKISHSDYLADFNKKTKHSWLKQGTALKEFYYVCPEGLIDAKELPEYAGLIYVYRIKNSVREIPYGASLIKKAKYSKTAKAITNDQKISILQKGTTRYWTNLEHIRRKINDK